MKIRSEVLAPLALALLLPMTAVRADDAAAGSKPAAAAAKPKKVEKVEIRCDTTTGSHIRRDKPDECAKNLPPTVTYQQKDIEATGQTDLGKALKQLDPRIQ